MVKVKRLSNKERRGLEDEFLKIGLSIKNTDLEQYEDQKIKLLLINKKPFAMMQEKKWIPTIQTLLEHKTTIPCVGIDIGAIPFITKGADLMRAGITKMDNFGVGKLVIICDNRHNKPLAVGISLFSSEDINKMEKGKVIKNLHHIGDLIWNFK